MPPAIAGLNRTVYGAATEVSVDTSRLVPEPPSRLSSSQQPKKKQRPARASSPTGSSVSILLLLLPLLAGVWAARQPSHAALDGGEALLVGAGVSIAAFVALWLPSFWKTTKDRSLAAVSVFLLVLWVVVGVFVTARLNTAVLAAEHTGSGRSSRCTLHLQHAIATVRLDASYCEIVDVGDVYVADLHPGALGLRWPGPPTIRKRSAAP